MSDRIEGQLKRGNHGGKWRGGKKRNRSASVGNKGGGKGNADKNFNDQIPAPPNNNKQGGKGTSAGQRAWQKRQKKGNSKGK